MLGNDPSDSSLIAILIDRDAIAAETKKAMSHFRDFRVLI